ncbi:MAG: MarR family winged helix-turn-helix transcriptional regulator [Acidobacteriaceae bacterium]
MTEPGLFIETLTDWFEIFRRRMMSGFFTYAKDQGLTMAQMGTLFHIHRMGACGVSDIGSHLGVTNSAASQMLERLVQLKLITRTEDPADRRVKQIVLTDKGLQVLRGSSKANQEWLEHIARSMTEDEREQVRLALATLIDKSSLLEISPN